jgi:hypothetical protein
MHPRDRSDCVRLFRHLTLVGVLAAAPLALASQPEKLTQAEKHVAALAPRLVQVMELPVGLTASRHIGTTASTQSGAFYNASYLARLQQRFGDSAVAGVLAHELGHIRRGHQHLGHGPGSGAAPTAELEAEEEAGCALANLKLSPQGYLRATASGATNASRQTTRTAARAAIQRGHQICSVGARLPRPDQATGAGVREDDGQDEGPRLGAAIAPQRGNGSALPQPAAKAPRAERPARRPQPARGSLAVRTGAVDSVTGYPIVQPGSLNAGDMARD